MQAKSETPGAAEDSCGSLVPQYQKTAPQQECVSHEVRKQSQKVLPEPKGVESFKKKVNRSEDNGRYRELPDEWVCGI